MLTKLTYLLGAIVWGVKQMTLHQKINPLMHLIGDVD
jgi:hypothetical protein